MSETTFHGAVEQIEMRGVAVAATGSPQVSILENIDWLVRTGDYWVIGGLQTSGKSLLLAAAGGITNAIRGEVHLFGRNVVDLSQEEHLAALLRIGMVFEGDRGLFTRLTVAENVALPLRYHKNWSEAEAAESVEAFLAEVGLSDSADLLAGRVSRAARHRILLARALVTKPDVLLLDNPLSRLDPRETTWWLGFLKRLSAGHPLIDGRPLTLAVTTDDLRPWREHGRQFAFLDQKRFNPLGGREQLEQSRETLLRELLAETWNTI